MVGEKDWRFHGTTGTSIRDCQAARKEKETRSCYHWKQRLMISRDPRHHYPVLKLKERGQQGILMGHKNFPGPPAPRSGSQVTRRETGGDYDGRQGLAIFRDVHDLRPHQPISKLQEGRHAEIMMGDKTC